MKFDITVKGESGDAIAEFIVGEQTMMHVLKTCRQGVDEGDGHEVPKEDTA